MRAEWDIERYLGTGRLVQVLPGYRTPDADIYAAYPQRQQLSARIRTFVVFFGGGRRLIGSKMLSKQDDAPAAQASFVLPIDRQRCSNHIMKASYSFCASGKG